ncbi:uncharacterized protein LOC143424053 [Xylocopa sonorina]|uniref:uncharacterized protein LOC143424053 n=1 Tax=Xylocopa sonorina TaxID=1818115 RepID=UPI00403B17DA
MAQEKIDKPDESQEVSLKEEIKDVINKLKEELEVIQLEAKTEETVVNVSDKPDTEKVLEKITVEEKSAESDTTPVEISKGYILLKSKESKTVEVSDTEKKEEAPLPETPKLETPKSQESEQKIEAPGTPSKAKKGGKSKERTVTEKTAPISAVESKEEPKLSQPSTPRSDKKKRKKQETKDKHTIESAQTEEKIVIEKTDTDTKPITKTTEIKISEVTLETPTEESAVPTKVQPETPTAEPEPAPIKQTLEESQLIKPDDLQPESQALIERSSTEENALKEEELAKVTDAGSPVEEPSSTALSKALIIEKTVTTVTTTTSLPGSLEVKPPNVKSVKSVEILESIPLPKIVGSKPTELITLCPETVEASLTTTYARVSDDSAVGIPSKASLDTIADSGMPIPDYADYIGSLGEDGQAVLFGSVQDRRRARSGTPLSARSKDGDVLEMEQGPEVSQATLSEIEGKIEEIRVTSEEEVEVPRETETVKSEVLDELMVESDDKGVKEEEGMKETVEDLSSVRKSADIKDASEKVKEPSSISKEAVVEEIKETKLQEVESKPTSVQEKAVDSEKRVDSGKVKNSKPKAKEVVSYFTDLIKPYWFNYRPYIQAESNFYRRFKVVQVVEENVPTASTPRVSKDIEKIVQDSIMKKPEEKEENVTVPSTPVISENIENIVQESITKKPEEKKEKPEEKEKKPEEKEEKPEEKKEKAEGKEEKPEDEKSEAESRKTALIEDVIKYPISTFYQLESQWIKTKQTKDKEKTPIPTEEPKTTSIEVGESRVEEKEPVKSKEVEQVLETEVEIDTMKALEEVTMEMKSTDMILNQTAALIDDVNRELDTIRKEEEQKKIVEKRTEEKEKQDEPEEPKKKEQVTDKKSKSEKPKKEKQPKKEKSKVTKDETKVQSPIKEPEMAGEQDVKVTEQITEQSATETVKNADEKESIKTEEPLITLQPEAEEVKLIIESLETEKAKEDKQPEDHEKQKEEEEAIVLKPQPVVEETVAEKKPSKSEKKKASKESKRKGDVKEKVDPTTTKESPIMIQPKTKEEKLLVEFLEAERVKIEAKPEEDKKVEEKPEEKKEDIVLETMPAEKKPNKREKKKESKKKEDTTEKVDKTLVLEGIDQKKEEGVEEGITVEEALITLQPKPEEVKSTVEAPGIENVKEQETKPEEVKKEEKIQELKEEEIIVEKQSTAEEKVMEKKPADKPTSEKKKGSKKKKDKEQTGATSPIKSIDQKKDEKTDIALTEAPAELKLQPETSEIKPAIESPQIEKPKEIQLEDKEKQEEKKEDIVLETQPVVEEKVAEKKLSKSEKKKASKESKKKEDIKEPAKDEKLKTEESVMPLLQEPTVATEAIVTEELISSGLPEQEKIEPETIDADGIQPLVKEDKAKPTEKPIKEQKTPTKSGKQKQPKEKPDIKTKSTPEKLPKKQEKQEITSSDTKMKHEEKSKKENEEPTLVPQEILTVVSPEETKNEESRLEIQEVSKEEVESTVCTKSWASIVSTKETSEPTNVPSLENLQIENVPTQELIAEAPRMENVEQLVETMPEEPQSPSAQQKPTKQQKKKDGKQEKKNIETKVPSTDTENEKEKVAIEKVEESLELVMKESNKSYAQVAASSKRSSPQLNQEDVVLLKPIPLQFDQNLDDAATKKEVTSEEEIAKAIEIEEEMPKLEEVVLTANVVDEPFIETDDFGMEPASWVEEIEKEALEEEISSASVAEAVSPLKMKDSWAAVVGKHVEPPPSFTPEEVVAKTMQIVERRPPPQIQVYVEETPQMVPTGKVIEVDEQGFMKFVNRKEMRSRRSRSRSRSTRREEGASKKSKNEKGNAKSTSTDAQVTKDEQEKGIEKGIEKRETEEEGDKKVADEKKEQSVEQKLQKQPEKKDSKKKSKSKTREIDTVHESKHDAELPVEKIEKQLEEKIEMIGAKEEEQAVKSEVPEIDKAVEVDKKKAQTPEQPKPETKEQFVTVSKKNKKSKKGKPDKEQFKQEVGNTEQIKQTDADQVLEPEVKSKDEVVKEPEVKGMKEMQEVKEMKEIKETQADQVIISEVESKPEPTQERKPDKPSPIEKRKGKSKEKKAKSIPEPASELPIQEEKVREPEIKENEDTSEKKEDVSVDSKLDIIEKLEDILTAAVTTEIGEIQEESKAPSPKLPQTPVEEKIADSKIETKEEVKEEQAEVEPKSKLSKKEKRKQKKKEKSATRATSEEKLKNAKPEELNTPENKEEVDAMSMTPKEEKSIETLIESVSTDKMKAEEKVKEKSPLLVPEEITDQIKLAPETMPKVVPKDAEPAKERTELPKPTEEKEEPKEQKDTAEKQVGTPQPTQAKPEKDVKQEESTPAWKEKSKRKTKQTKKTKQEKQETTEKSMDKEPESPKDEKGIEALNTDSSAIIIQDDSKDSVDQTKDATIAEDSVTIDSESTGIDIKSVEVAAEPIKIETESVSTVIESVESATESKKLETEEKQVTEVQKGVEEIKEANEPNVILEGQTITKEEPVKVPLKDEEKVDSPSIIEETPKPQPADKKVAKEEKSKGKKSKEKRQEEIVKSDQKKIPETRPQIVKEKTPEAKEDKIIPLKAKLEEDFKPIEILVNGKLKENGHPEEEIKEPEEIVEIEPELVKELETIIQEADQVPEQTVPIEKLLDELESPITIDSIQSQLETEEEFEKCILSEPEIETVDIVIEPAKPKVQFYIADEILVLSPEKKKPAQTPLILKTLSELSRSKFLSLDSGFWPDKHPYHEAERYLFEKLANYTREQPSNEIRRDSNDPDDFDGDRDGSLNDRRGNRNSLNPYFMGGPHTERLIADLPGGIGSWSDYSTYLSSENEQRTDQSAELIPQKIEGPVSDPTLLREQFISESPSVHLEDDRFTSKFDVLSLESVPATSSENVEEKKSQSLSTVELSTSTPRESSPIPSVPDHCPDPKEHLGRERGSMQQRTPIVETERETGVAEDEAEKRIRGIKDIIQERLMVLQLSLSNLKGTYLPRDSIDSMLSALRNLLTELQSYNQEARQLEEDLRKIPADLEAQKLLSSLGEVQTRIATLLTQAEQGCATLEGARGQQEKRGHDIHAYKEFLEETDVWLKNVVASMKEQQPTATNKALQDELSSHAQRLSELESLPEISTLANVLKNALLEVMSRLQQRQQEICDEEARADETSDRDDATLDQAPSIHSSIESSMPSLADVSLQTGQSLLANDVVEKPQQLTKQTSTNQIPVSTVCHSLTTQTVDTLHPNAENLQTQEAIKILKTTEGDHDVIEIATKNLPTTFAQEVVQERPDTMAEDIVVDMKYQDPTNTDNTTSELNIVHAAPQSFETVLVEPDDVTTEVVVDEDGSKRIIVRKLRRTTVTSRQTTQQHLSSTSTAIGDAPSVVQAFSEATMRDQQVTVTTAKPNGTIESTTKQIYGGRVTTGIPYKDVNVEEYESPPQYTHMVTQGHIRDISPQPFEEGLLMEGGEYQAKTASVHAVVQQVTRRVIRKTRRIIRKVTIVDGKETTTEEIIEEPEEVEIDEKNIPHISINVIKQEEQRQVGADGRPMTEEKSQDRVVVEDVTDKASKEDSKVEKSVADDTPMQGPFFGAFAKDMHPSTGYEEPEKEEPLVESKKDRSVAEEKASDADARTEQIVEIPLEPSDMDIQKEQFLDSPQESLIQSELGDQIVKPETIQRKPPQLVDKYEHEHFLVEVNGKKSLPSISQAFIDAEVSAAFQSPSREIKIREAQLPEDLAKSSIESIVSEDVASITKATCKSVDAPVSSETPGIELEDRTVDIETHDDIRGTVDVLEEIPPIETATRKTPEPLTKLESTEVQKTVHVSGKLPVQAEEIVSTISTPVDTKKPEESEALPIHVKQQIVKDSFVPEIDYSVDDYVDEALKPEYKPIFHKVEISLAVKKEGEEMPTVSVKSQAEPEAAPRRMVKEDVDIRLPADKESTSVIHDKIVQTSSSISEPAVATSDKSVTASEKGVVTSDKSVTASEKGVVTSDKSVTASEKGVVTSDKSVTASEKGVVTSDKSVTASEKGVVTFDKSVSASEKGVATSDKSVITSEKEVVTSDRSVIISEKEIVTSDKSVITSEREETDKSIVTSEKEETSDNVITSEKDDEYHAVPVIEPEVQTIVATDTKVEDTESLPKSMETSASLVSTIADSMEIDVALSDSSKQISEPPHPDITRTRESREVSLKDDTSQGEDGYEADRTMVSATTPDDENVTRTKRRRKKKQRIRSSREEEQTEFPKTTTDEGEFTDESTQAESEDAKATKKKKKKKKREDVDVAKEKTAPAAILSEADTQTTPRVFTVSVATSPKQEEVCEIDVQTSPHLLEEVKIFVPEIEEVHEGMQTSPQISLESSEMIETPKIEEIHAEVQTSPLPVLDFGGQTVEEKEPELDKPTVQHSEMQTSPLRASDFSVQAVTQEVPLIEEISTQTVETPAAKVEEYGVQTSPIEDVQPIVVTAETEEIQVQTVGTEVVSIEAQTSPTAPSTEIETQTAEKVVVAVEQQTTPPPIEEKVLTGIAVQTVTPESVKTIEIESQTSKPSSPEKTTLDFNIQADLIEQPSVEVVETQTTPEESPRQIDTQETESQTILPEPTQETMMQTSPVCVSPIKIEVCELSSQTSLEEIKQQMDEQSQTIAPEKIETLDSSVQIQTSELVPHVEESVQFIPETREESEQTSIEKEKPSLVTASQQTNGALQIAEKEKEVVVTDEEGNVIGLTTDVVDSSTEVKTPLQLTEIPVAPDVQVQETKESSEAIIPEKVTEPASVLGESMTMKESKEEERVQELPQTEELKPEFIKEEAPPIKKETEGGGFEIHVQATIELSASDTGDSTSKLTDTSQDTTINEDLSGAGKVEDSTIGKRQKRKRRHKTIEISATSDKDLESIFGHPIESRDVSLKLSYSDVAKKNVGKEKSPTGDAGYLETVCEQEDAVQKDRTKPVPEERTGETEESMQSTGSEFTIVTEPTAVKDAQDDWTVGKERPSSSLESEVQQMPVMTDMPSPEPMDTTEEPFSSPESILQEDDRPKIKTYADIISETSKKPEKDQASWELSHHAMPQKGASSKAFLLAETMEYEPQHQITQSSQTTKAISDRMQNLRNAKQPSHLGNILHIAHLDKVANEKLAEERAADVRKELSHLRDAAQEKDAVAVEDTMVVIVETISTWLETIEYRIFLSKECPAGPSHDDNTYVELKDEVENVEENIQELNNIWRLVETNYPGEDRNNLQECLDALMHQVKMIEDTTDDGEKHLTNELARWDEFVTSVNNMYRLIEEQRRQLNEIIELEASTKWKLQELEKMENMNRCHMWKTATLLTTSHELLRDYPGKHIPEETYLAHEMTKAIEHGICIERERLLQLLALAEEYEQTLREFAQITEIAENLLESPISVMSLEHLQEEMQKHRKFFVNLNHCRAILESLEGNLDPETRTKYSDLHEELHGRAISLLDQAASRAQQMALAASRWIILEQGVKEERGWLQVAHQRVPDLQTVTSSDYDQYISLYQSLASDVATHHARLIQLLNVARGLQDLVNIEDPEDRYGEALDVIVKLQDNVESSLRRLLAFRESWRHQEMLMNRLENWMTTVEKELSIHRDPSAGHIRQFWELKAQYEVHNNIRQEGNNSFEQALRIIPLSDEMLQRQFHSEVQDRWNDVTHQINTIQEQVTRNISSEEISSNEKLKLLERELNELRITIDGFHGVLRTEEELDLYIERLTVLSDRISLIQDELGRLGLLPVAESEKVGVLLSSARRIESQIIEELDAAQLLRERLQAIQRGLSRVRKAHQRQSSILDQCEGSERQGSDVVAAAVDRCQTVADELAILWQDIMGLRQLLHTLPTVMRVSVSPVSVERDISNLQDAHTDLEARCSRLLSLLKNRLSLWRRFERQLEMVQQSVQEADYMMELLTVQGSVDYDRLLKATERLEGLSGDLGEREVLIGELREAAEPLREGCAAEVREKVEAAVNEAVQAWEDTRAELDALCTKYQHACRLWQQYKDSSAAVKAWVDTQMDSVANLPPEEAVKHIKICEETMAEHKERVAELRSMVAQIASDVGLDASGPLHCEVEALGQRLEDIRETLSCLADTADARALNQELARGDLCQTKNFLDSVQQASNYIIFPRTVSFLTRSVSRRGTNVLRFVSLFSPPRPPRGRLRRRLRFDCITRSIEHRKYFILHLLRWERARFSFLFLRN